LKATRAGADARSAESLSGAAAGTPYVELQQEGIDSNFDWQPNAQTTLRLGTAFNLPAHARARRELKDASRAWVETVFNTSILETTAGAGTRWLELAAVEERLGIARRRLGRLEKALDLQRVRLELGEIAGTDVTQIELAWAGAVSTVNRLEADRAKAIEKLRWYCGAQCALPRAGDLEELQNATMSPSSNSDSEHLSPLWLAIDLQATMESSDAQVMESTAWGRPEAELEWEHIPGLEGMSSFDAFGVRFRFPLPTGSAGKRMREAAAARRIKADADLHARHAELKARFAGARAAAESAETTLERLDPVLRDIEDSEHSLAEQFRLGAISYLVYIDGVSRFDDIRLEAVDARAALLRDRLDMAVLKADAAYFPIPELAPTSDSKVTEKQ